MKDADLIFNTVPALIIDASVLTQVPYDVVIIDLASKPGGVVTINMLKKEELKPF